MLSNKQYTRKNYRGEWAAESEVKLEGKRVIQFHTSKRSNGMIATTATVGVRDGISFSYTVFQDFSKTLVQTKARCTEKTINAQHTSVVENESTMAALLAEVENFYAKELA